MNGQKKEGLMVIAVSIIVLSIIGLAFYTDVHTVIMSNNQDSALLQDRILTLSAGFIVCSVITVSAAFLYIFHRKSVLTNNKKVTTDEIPDLYGNTDVLTNLPNRNAIKIAIEDWLKSCRADKQNGGAFFLDIDNFQSVNSMFGHNAGDIVLTEVAERLTKLVGEENILGRIGGDEFALLLNNVKNLQELQEFADSIVEAFKKPFIIHGIIMQLTCSIGAILFHWDETEADKEYDNIFNRGEFVLSLAKQTKKGSYCIFNKAIGEEADRRSKMQHSLKNAVENEELLIYFQAQYDFSRGKIIGFEALVRWNSKQFGMVSPMEFISLAEKTGYIKDIGRFVIDKTFAFAQHYQDTGICVSFNCSPVELLQADFTDYVIERFDHYHLKKHSVAIEITESCLIESFDEVNQKLNILSEYGLLVYLDDFGTGFSSLNYLKSLPINSVKIDKSFIDEISTNKAEKDIVEMIVGLAGKLNLSVIAEGVEVQNQIQHLQQCGCNVFQGYYISKPIPEKEVSKFLNEHT